MAFFDDLKSKVSETTQSAGQKAKNVAETAKMNSQISDLTKSITGLYNEVGMKYYESNKDSAEPEYRELFDKISEAFAKREELKEQIRSIKGINVCNNCGAEVPAGQKFCSGCGSQVIFEEEKPVEAEKFCPTCGSKCQAGQKFCSKCGSAV